MALTYLEDVKPHEDAGMTDQEIFDDVWSVDTRYKKNIWASAPSGKDVQSMVELLGDYGVLYLNDDGSASWKGPLIAAVNTTATGLEADPDPVVQASGIKLRIGFGRLMGLMQASGQIIHTLDKSETGALCTAIIDISKTIVQNDGSPNTATDVQEDMDTLTGGLYYGGTTVETIDELRQSYNSEQLQEVRSQAQVDVENRARAAIQAARQARVDGKDAANIKLDGDNAYDVGR